VTVRAVRLLVALEAGVRSGLLDHVRVVPDPRLIRNRTGVVARVALRDLVALETLCARRLTGCDLRGVQASVRLGGGTGRVLLAVASGVRHVDRMAALAERGVRQGRGIARVAVGAGRVVLLVVLRMQPDLGTRELQERLVLVRRRNDLALLVAGHAVLLLVTLLHAAGRTVLRHGRPVDLEPGLARRRPDVVAVAAQLRPGVAVLADLGIVPAGLGVELLELSRVRHLELVAVLAEGCVRASRTMADFTGLDGLSRVAAMEC